jgi:hypothetical protein
VALIVSAGRAGEFGTVPTCVDTLLVTFCAASTEMSTWTSRKPRPKNVSPMPRWARDARLADFPYDL